MFWYWRSVEPFDSKLFLIGIAGSILDTVGKSFIQTAFARGPAGPVTAFVEMNNVLLIILDSIRTWTLPSGLEILGFILGISGGLCFVFQQQVYKFKDYVLDKLCCLHRPPQFNDNEN